MIMCSRLSFHLLVLSGILASATSAVSNTQSNYTFTSTQGSNATNASDTSSSSIFISTSASFHSGSTASTPAPKSIQSTINSAAEPASASPPPQTGKKFIVKMSLTLPLTLSQFNATAQLLFRRQIAKVAGLPAETGWAQVNITVQGARRRRLLEGGVAVAVAIIMPDAASAASAATALSADRVNAALSAVGLPAAQITSAPTVTETGGDSSPPASLSSAAPPARAAALARLLLLSSLLAAAAAGGRIAP